MDYKKRLSLFFYLLSFTIAIFIFSIGTSAVKAEKENLKKYNGENNKLLNFYLEEKLTLDSLKEVLKSYKLSIIVRGTLEGSNVIFESYLKTDGLFYQEDMKKGEFFNRGDFESKEKVFLTTSLFLKDGEEFNFNYINDRGEQEVFKGKSSGEVYSKERKIILPFNSFNNYFQGSYLGDENIKIIMAGEIEDINKGIFAINEYLKSLDENNFLEVFDYTVADKSEEGKTLKIMSYLIVLVAVMNSISICSLWINSKEKEIVMRKIVGATNIDIGKIFFFQLGKIAVLSLTIALMIQGLLSYSLGGYFMLINIKIKKGTIIYSIVFTFIMVLLTTIPFLRKIKKFNLVEMLKGE